MQESGLAFLRKYSEAARHNKPIKISYILFWYCALITLAILACLLIVYLASIVAFGIQEQWEGNGTAT